MWTTDQNSVIGMVNVLGEGVVSPLATRDERVVQIQDRESLADATLDRLKPGVITLCSVQMNEQRTKVQLYAVTFSDLIELASDLPGVNCVFPSRISAWEPGFLAIQLAIASTLLFHSSSACAFVCSNVT